MEPVAARQHRVDERRADVKPPATRAEHPFDQLTHLVDAENRRREFVPPVAAIKIREGSLIQISSTVGSSRYRCNGPKPATSATNLPTRISGSSSASTAPVRLRPSWSCTT